MESRDIVLIVTDQQRHDQVGWASGGFFETPALDALARDGVVFSQAYSGGATCIPGRVGLLTGCQMKRLSGSIRPVWPNDVWTVGHGLRAAGYQTALIGKMHFHPIHADHGFDVHRACEHLTNVKLARRADGSLDADDYHQWLVARGAASWDRFEEGEAPTLIEAPRPDGGGWEFPHDLALHPTTWIEEEVRRFVAERDDDRPLFLVISFPHPHVPLNPLGPYEHRYDPATFPVPAGGAALNQGLPGVFRDAMVADAGPWGSWRVADHGEAELRLRQTKIRALVRHIDDTVGRLLELFPLDRTLVGFTSDHGDYGGRRGLAGKTPWIPFDDLVRVPLMLAGAGVEGGREVGAVVQSSDLPLTFCELAGLELPAAEFDSQSLVPYLDASAPAGPRERPALFTHNPTWPGLRRGRFKLIERRKENELVLFDLETDPDESVNLADEPALAAELADLRVLLTQSLTRPPPVIEMV